MTPLRPSTEVKIERAGQGLARFVFGVLLAGSFAFPEYMELKSDAAPWHIFFLACGVASGLLVAFWPVVAPVLDGAIPRAQKIIVLVRGGGSAPTTTTVTVTQPPKDDPKAAP